MLYKTLTIQTPPGKFVPQDPVSSIYHPEYEAYDFT